MPTVNPAPQHRISDQDAEWSEVVDRALQGAQVVADGSERQRLAKTLRRLSPGTSAALTAEDPLRETCADFEKCLEGLARV